MTDSYSEAEAKYLAHKWVNENLKGEDVSAVVRVLLEELERRDGAPRPKWVVEPVLCHGRARWELVSLTPPHVSEGYRVGERRESRGTYCYRWQAERAARHAMREVVEVKAP